MRIFIFLSAVLNFLLKKRLQQDTCYANYIGKHYGLQTLQNVRKLEKLKFKSKKLQKDIEFLRCCISNNVSPRFLQCRLANSNLRYSRQYSDSQRGFLDLEVNAKVNILGKCSRLLTIQISLVKNQLSFFDYFSSNFWEFFVTCIENYIENFYIQSKLIIKTDRNFEKSKFKIGKLSNVCLEM